MSTSTSPDRHIRFQMEMDYLVSVMYMERYHNSEFEPKLTILDISIVQMVTVAILDAILEFVKIPKLSTEIMQIMILHGLPLSKSTKTA